MKELSYFITDMVGVGVLMLFISRKNTGKKHPPIETILTTLGNIGEEISQLRQEFENLNEKLNRWDRQLERRLQATRERDKKVREAEARAKKTRPL